MENIENNTITDIDGNTYNVVQIGKQLWIAENLNVSKYRNGDEIPEVTDINEWRSLTTGAWCYYDNQKDRYEKTYGKLYNWYALNDPRGLMPEGFKVPSDEEWATLIDYLGGEHDAGAKMKQIGKEHWANDKDATNQSGFTGLPGGGRVISFSNICSGGQWWTSSEKSSDMSFFKQLGAYSSNVIELASEKCSGFSIRGIKETDEKKEDSVQQYINPKDILIGEKLWDTKNLDVCKYRNGDEIPQVQDAAEWSTLKTGAWCYYENKDENGTIYGKLYNWYAINDPRGLAPEGYFIPSKEDWETLTCGSDFNVSKLKERGTKHWKTDRYGESGQIYLNTNTIGFTALPGGSRFNDGTFHNIGDEAYWWTTTEINETGKYRFFMHAKGGSAQWSDDYINYGFSVRCYKYPAPPKIEKNIVTDLDGKAYNGVQIGSQLWTSENLNVSKYRNGDEIPQVQNAKKWAELTTGAWCYYENIDENGTTYGKLYNGYAINDPRGLAPVGFHIPTDEEWTVLTEFLGGERIAGLKLKETGKTHWTRESAAGLLSTNEYGFSSLPGGLRLKNGKFDFIGKMAYMWSNTETNCGVFYRSLDCSDTRVFRDENLADKIKGFSVRCIKD